MDDITKFQPFRVSEILTDDKIIEFYLGDVVHYSDQKYPDEFIRAAHNVAEAKGMEEELYRLCRSLGVVSGVMPSMEVMQRIVVGLGVSWPLPKPVHMSYGDKSPAAAAAALAARRRQAVQRLRRRARRC